MLPKNQRLSRKSFLLVQKSGIRQGSAPLFLICYYRPSGSGIVGPRFAIVTSKKFHRRAVVRNNFKRKIYRFLQTSSLKTNTDIIFYPHKDMLKFSYEKIGLTIDSVLSKITPLRA